MPAPRLVIFDCDGVLVDSERISHTVLQTMLAECGVRLTLEETYAHFMGASSQKCLHTVQVLTGADEPPVDFMRRFGERTFAAFGTELQPVPGVPELLRTLDTPFCVASNGPRAKMQLTLGHTGLLPYFEGGRLFSADDVARPKPAPDLFVHAAHSLGAAPADCLVVEDSPTGVAAARAAGMRVLGYAATTARQRLLDAGAHDTFAHMARLPEWLATGG